MTFPVSYNSLYFRYYFSVHNRAGVIFLYLLWACTKIAVWRKCLHQATSGDAFPDLQDFFLLGPTHVGWLFTVMEWENFTVLGWIWRIHLCRTSEFILDFMNCLNLYFIWISSPPHLFHCPHMEREKSGACKSGVGEWNIKTDWY